MRYWTGRTLPTAVIATALLGAAAWGGPAHALPALPGDLNLDGKVNVSDTQCSVLAVSNPGTLPGCHAATSVDGDLNCDGAENVSDLQLIVLLAVGNPLSAAIDVDADTRTNSCDPDIDGDGWSNACEEIALTDASDPAAHPGSAFDCPGAELTTACRISGGPGDPFRCDILLAAKPDTKSGAGLSVVIQVDPAAAALEHLDTSRDCAGGPCTYGAPAPPAVAAPGGQALALYPACTDADCSTAWKGGKVGITLAAIAGTPLTVASYQGDFVPLLGEAFVVSVVGSLEASVLDLPIEVLAPLVVGVDGVGYPTSLIDAAGVPTLVTDGTPDGGGGPGCFFDSDCLEGPPCTAGTCSLGECSYDPAPGGCDDGDACTTGDFCLDGACVGEPMLCDDDLDCTTDSCADGVCSSALDAGFCVAAGVCEAEGSASCLPVVQLTEVGPDYYPAGDDLIEILNAGAATVGTAAIELVANGVSAALPAATLAPGDRLVVHTGAGGDAGLEVFLQGAAGGLALAGGDLALRVAGATVDYAAWGDGPWPGMGAAVAAGLWQDGERLVTGAVTPGTTLQSETPGPATTWGAAPGTPGQPTLSCATVTCIEVACADGENNDLDGALDCDDSDCDGPDCQLPDLEVCDVVGDEDGDGFEDCVDPDCAGFPGCAAAPAFNEVLLVEGGDSIVEIANLGNAPATISGLYLCSSDACAVIPGELTVFPGLVGTVHTESDVDAFGSPVLGGAIGGLAAVGGELVLATADPPSAGAVLDYLRWGDVAPVHEAAAVAAAAWPPGASIYTGPFVPGDSLANNGLGTPGPSSWDIHTAPSIHAGNPTCGTPDQCRESRCTDEVDDDGDGEFDCFDADCSAAGPCEPRVVLNEVVIDGPDDDKLEIANLGGGAQLLTGWRVQFNGASQFLLPAGTTLAPGGYVVLHKSAGDNDTQNLYGVSFNYGTSGGELVLASGSTSNAVNYRDYVRWGPSPKAKESKAVEAGEWETNTFIDMTGFVAGTQALVYDGAGDTAADWAFGAISVGNPNPVEFGNCLDLIDNDSDGLTDCLDDDCLLDLDCAGEICGNGVDDDVDGATDCADVADCAGHTFCDEAGKCEDLIDNDVDGATDCADVADCAGIPSCDEALSCADDVDNDVDGLTDCADDECAGTPTCIEPGNCDDDIDNDGDGLTDCEQQTACGAEPWCDESVHCLDGIDNDADGFTDCADAADCDGTPECVEVECEDLADNDQDGATDCDDTDCADLPVCVGVEAEPVINELILDGPSGGDLVELRNLAPATATLEGLLLCLDESCFTFPPGSVIPPGGYLLVETGPGSDFEGHVFAGAALGDPSGLDGQAGLHSAQPISDPANLIDWMQWGNDGHSGEPLAVGDGQWAPGTTVPAAAYQAGISSYEWLGTGEGAEFWAVSFSPSPGAPNAGCVEPGSCAELVCDDGLDGDGDGDTDCLDFDCGAFAGCLVEAGNCADGIDNDGDGKTDCYDKVECAGEPHCDESLACQDGVDNDADFLVDCFDPDCTGIGPCDEAAACSDLTDNDEDDLTDCADPDCATDPACTETDTECGDGADNDGDAAIDCLDPDCTGSLDCVEIGHCLDGIDNDLDSLTDCLDLADCDPDPDCDGRVLLGEVGFDVDGVDVIEIANPGNTPVDLSGHWVCGDATCVQLEEGMSLSGQEALRVNSGTDASTGGNFPFGAELGLSPAGGSARLYAPTAPGVPAVLLIDFVQWGAPGQEGEAAALAEALWPGGVAVPTFGLQPDDTLGRYGISHAPTNWTIRQSPSLQFPNQPCSPLVCRETWCGDTVDNDNNDAIDCADAFCAPAVECLEPGHCDDDVDNDGDGATDCGDDECLADPACALAFDITEVQLDGADGQDHIEVHNPSAAPMDLGGVMLCSDVGACYAIAPGTVLAPDAYLVVHSGSGSDGPADLYAGGSLGALGPAGGQLAATDGGAPDDAGALVSFVGWGQHGGSLHQAAVDAGLWLQSESMELAAYQAGSDALISDGSGSTNESWFIATGPSLGAPNPSCAVPGSCRENHCDDLLDDDADAAVDCADSDCSGVAPCSADLVINEIFLEDPSGAGLHDWIELRNRGNASQDLQQWRVCSGIVGSNCYIFLDNFVLGAGGHVVIHGETGTDTQLHRYAGSSFSDLKADKGHVSLHLSNAISSPAAMVDYVAWGLGGRPREATAVAAGQWAPDTFVTMAPWVANASSLVYVGEGHSYLDWNITQISTEGGPNVDCGQPGQCHEVLCSDGEDDDLDGATDCADAECVDDAYCSEAGNCGDSADNDGDSQVDCADDDCVDDPLCIESINCQDGVDNDLNGAVDCADLACQAKPHCAEAGNCGDSTDNDVDGLTDCADDQCSGDPGCPEAAHCADGLDNDLDGAIDCADIADCSGQPACDESLACDDGVDNDVDGTTDCSDNECLAGPQCQGGNQCSSTVELSCGVSHSGNLVGAPTFSPVGICDQPGGFPSPLITHKFTAECSGVVEVSLLGDPADTLVLAVVENHCSSLSHCNYVNAGTPQTATIETTAAVDYYALVFRTPSSTGGGSYTLTLTCLDCDESSCTDSFDNNGDGLTDCDDPDCESDVTCVEAYHCGNDVDDDLDGLTDCDDDQCVGSGDCLEWSEGTNNCGDGIDNDADGLIDCADPDCPHYFQGSSDGLCEASEHPLFTGDPNSCKDGVDNDGDVFTDCQDSNCSAEGDCTEAGACDDGIDNDGDGTTDCSDFDCNSQDPVCLGSQDCLADEDIACGATFTRSLANGQDKIGDNYCGHVGGHQNMNELIFRLIPACTGTVRIEVTPEDPGVYDLSVLEAFCDTASFCGDGTWVALGEAAQTTVLEFQPNQYIPYYLIVEGFLGTTGAFTMKTTCFDCGEYDCGDGADNDGNGATDCDDLACDGISPCVPEVLCDDGFDGDFDGMTDCADPDCAGVGDCAYPCGPTPLSCGSTTVLDLEDPDYIGFTDIMDSYACSANDYSTPEEAFEVFFPGGSQPVVTVELTQPPDIGQAFVDLLALDSAQPACMPDSCIDVGLMGTDGLAEVAIPSIPGGTALFSVESRGGLSGPVRLSVSCANLDVEATCVDLIDDDGDGFTDCDDPDCNNHVLCTPEAQCANDLDDDYDGLTDCFDPDCDGSSNCVEFDCGDGMDDEPDGLTDCADPDCALAAGCFEFVCTDLVDDDDDGFTDCDDDDCATALGCVQQCLAYQPILCGQTITGQSTGNGTDLFDAYDCDPVDLCQFGSYAGNEMSFGVSGICDGGLIEAVVTYSSGFGAFYAIVLGNDCDHASQTCGGTCNEEPGTVYSSDGSQSTPAAVLLYADFNEAFWINVESDFLFGGGATTTFDISVECLCP